MHELYKFNILIVDNNSHFVDLLESILSFYFYDRIKTIVSAGNAEECLSVLQKKKIDIVFIDYNIPGINGAELTNFISYEFRFVKIIAISYSEENHILNSMILNGARDYILKEDIDRESLDRCLTN